MTATFIFCAMTVLDGRSNRFGTSHEASRTGYVPDVPLHHDIVHVEREDILTMDASDVRI